MKNILKSTLEEALLAIIHQNNNVLVDCLSLTDEDLHSKISAVFQAKKSLTLDKEAIKQWINSLSLDFEALNEKNPLWIDYFIQFTFTVITMNSLDRRDIRNEENVYNEILSLLQLLHRILQNSTNWILPLLYHVNETLWKCASNTSAELSEDAARQLNKSLTLCLNDRASPMPQSRKWGFYRCAALLFRSYFHLHQLNLCGNVLRAMGAADLPPIQMYPTSHSVEFRYWLGRYWFVSENFGKAEEELFLAFVHCHPLATNNKRKILHYLIPLKILNKGHLPSLKLLDRHQMNEFYKEAISFLRSGNLALYQRTLRQNETFLLKIGTFLIWEKLLLPVYRNLIKRVFILREQNTRLPISMIEGALAAMGEKRDLDEVSCIMAVLIAKGYVKGYISQEKNIIVLSQKDPFPIYYSNQ